MKAKIIGGIEEIEFKPFSVKIDIEDKIDAFRFLTLLNCSDDIHRNNIPRFLEKHEFTVDGYDLWKKIAEPIKQELWKQQIILI